MSDIRISPIFTDTYEFNDSFTPQSNSIYVYGKTGEQRSSHIKADWSEHNSIDLLEITEDIEHRNSIKIGEQSISLRNSTEIASIWHKHKDKLIVYIDMTGLSHSVWANLIKSAIDNNLDVRVVYVEPEEYQLSSVPLAGQFYDLSEKIEGIEPLVGFAKFYSPVKKFVFIPLLGFEGTRFKYVMEQLEPEYNNIYPFIGMPGFKPWYVFETLKNNISTLSDRMWQSINYTPSDCPFSCYNKIQNIFDKNKDKGLKIAIIGTKPHALGAIMFYLNNPEVEIIYDHPIRKANRTIGIAKLHVYYISHIVKANPNRNNRRHIVR
jgi:hypothetical protein